MKQDDPQPKAKPFEIPKLLIYNAWKRVAANKGAPGVDKESIQAYQTDLGSNLYKLWNRMSSGSYHPQPVRQVLIPKGDGFRSLGIPTVADRTAQMAAKMIIEPRLEQIFHPSSYGYRPGRGAKDAVEQVRRNCWRYDWVLDMDIKAFLDTSSYCTPFHGKVLKRLICLSNALIYKPICFPLRTWTAESLPDFTRCNTV